MGVGVRCVVAGVACVAAVAAGGMSAGVASAADVPIDFTASTTTVVKKLGQTITFADTPITTTLSTEDFKTGTISAPFTLPPASSNLRLGPITLATVGLSIVDASPVSGTAIFADGLSGLSVKAQQSFKVKVTNVAPLGLSTGSAAVNLVPAGANCVTTATTANLAGDVNLSVSPIDSTLRGTYTIPPFSGCGPVVTPLLNTLVSGPGNPLNLRLRTGVDSPATAQLKALARR